MKPTPSPGANAAASSSTNAAPSAQTAANRAQGMDVLGRVADTIASRRPENGGDPASSYVAKLFSKAPDSFLKKIGEEATELVMAAKDGHADRIVSETADLWFHCLVALEHYGLRPEAVLAELARREGLSGLQEKAQRPE
jgi:phosphoribosyl-ATP pyrophosphohydrolase